jgi:hypothetical protein
LFNGKEEQKCKSVLGFWLLILPKFWEIALLGFAHPSQIKKGQKNKKA